MSATEASLYEQLAVLCTACSNGEWHQRRGIVADEHGERQLPCDAKLAQ